MAIAGTHARVYVSGDPVAFTDEATTAIVANQSYRVTSTSKRVWSPTGTIVVKDGGVAVDAVADPYSINRLTGVVTFDNTASRTITVSGDYLPMSLAAECKSYNYSINCPALSDAAFGSVWDSSLQGLKTVSGSLGRWASADTYFTDALTSGAPVVLEMWSDAAGAFDFRIWASLDKVGVEGAVAGLIEEGVEFSGFRDVDERVISA